MTLYLQCASPIFQEYLTKSDTECHLSGIVSGEGKFMTNIGKENLTQLHKRKKEKKTSIKKRNQW